MAIKGLLGRRSGTQLFYWSMLSWQKELNPSSPSVTSSSCCQNVLPRGQDGELMFFLTKTPGSTITINHALVQSSLGPNGALHAAGRAGCNLLQDTSWTVQLSCLHCFHGKYIIHITRWWSSTRRGNRGRILTSITNYLGQWVILLLGMCKMPMLVESWSMPGSLWHCHNKNNKWLSSSTFTRLGGSPKTDIEGALNQGYSQGLLVLN